MADIKDIFVAFKLKTPGGEPVRLISRPHVPWLACQMCKTTDCHHIKHVLDALAAGKLPVNTKVYPETLLFSKVDRTKC
jgi:hypothetical protein